MIKFVRLHAASSVRIEEALILDRLGQRLKKSNQAGFALALVLWTLALFSILATTILASTRLQNLQSLADLRNSQAILAAEAGIPLAIHRLRVRPDAILSLGKIEKFDLHGIPVATRIWSEHGKLDLNFCQPQLFARLLRYAGAGSDQAEKWALQLAHRRNQGKPLLLLEELLDFQPPDPATYKRVLPLVTLWSGRGVPDPTFASKGLRTALNLSALEAAISNPGSTITIESTARLNTGEAAVVEATLSMESENKLEPFQVLRWQEKSLAVTR